MKDLSTLPAWQLIALGVFIGAAVVALIDWWRGRKKP
jgi:hypothetical protein